MLKLLNSLVCSIAIAATVHLSFVDLAVAETTEAMKKAADKANWSEFKTDPSSLYSTQTNSNIKIIGASPNGNVSVSQKSLYYGVTGQSASDGKLPDINEYEDLYGYRDQQLGNLEAGTGKFNSTGSVNAEAAAVEILKGTASTPSVSADAWLKTTRDVLTQSNSEFGQCIIKQVTGSNTYTYNDTYTETCDQLLIDTTAMDAQREYYGPDRVFNYSESDGKKYCGLDGKKIEVDSKATCGKLSILTKTPTIANGTMSARACDGVDGCVVLHFAQDSKKAAILKFTIADSVNMRAAKIITSGVKTGSGGGYVTYQGSPIKLTSGSAELPSVLKTQGTSQALGLYAGNARQPPSGSTLTNGDKSPPTTGAEKEYSMSSRATIFTSLYWEGTAICTKSSASASDDCSYVEKGGWNYFVDAGNCSSKACGVYRTKLETREPASGMLFSVHCRGHDCDETVYAYGVFTTSVGHDGNRDVTRFIWDEKVVATVSGNVTSVVGADGCTYYKKSIRIPGHGDGDDTTETGIYRICPKDGYITASANVRLSFDPTLFSTWQYNATRWKKLQALLSDGLISLKFTVKETVKKSNGCVRAYIASSGKVGERCGTDIPVGVFTGLTDRAAIKITVTPVVTETTDVEGDTAMTETNTCKALQKDTSCSYLSRECVETSSDGSCSIYENTYQCSKSSTYTSPVVKEINICSSSLSCLGDDCVFNNGSDGSGDLADAASKLAAADMILSDMNCSVDPSKAANAEAALKSCQLFTGEDQRCKKVTLGLANCCKNASGVSIADYLQLAFAVSRVSNTVSGTALDNPVTSAWVSLEKLSSDSYSRLTRPLTEVWDSIVGNSDIAKTAAKTFSMDAIKQTMMKNAAKWMGQTFGPQAANTVFQVGGNAAIGANGSLASGQIGLTTGAATVMSAVMMAYTIYTLVNVLAGILFACSDNELDLMTKRALKSAHYVGTYCSNRVLGKCLKRKESYCTFSSPLSRILNEQARLQLGISWGSAKSPNCQGITLAQFQSLDMSKVDLSEWTGMLMSSGMIDLQAVTDIDSLTGSTSTLGESLDGLYERQDAITRNTKKLKNVDLDAVRDDAVTDFGQGTTKQ